MENFCKGAALGLVAGMVAGSIIVAKNKQLSSKIRKSLGIAEEKMQEAKEFVEEKIEESKNEFNSKNGNCAGGYDKCCEEKSNFDALKNDSAKELNKKYKN